MARQYLRQQRRPAPGNQCTRSSRINTMGPRMKAGTADCREITTCPLTSAYTRRPTARSSFKHLALQTRGVALSARSRRPAHIASNPLSRSDLFSGMNLLDVISRLSMRLKQRRASKPVPFPILNASPSFSILILPVTLIYRAALRRCSGPQRATCTPALSIGRAQPSSVP